MKDLVLSGGTGKRLRPITHMSAKQLISVGGKPVLFYGLEAIRDASISKVGIIVGETVAEIEETVGDGSHFGLDVTYILQQEPLGLAHAVLIPQEFLGEDDFLIYPGDNIVLGGVTDLADQFRSGKADAQILLTAVPDPRKSGVAELEDTGQVIALEEKPARPRSNLALAGVYLFSSVIHQAARGIRPSWRGELEIADAIQWLIDAGHRVESTVITPYWKDTGTVEDLLEVNRMLLESLEPLVAGDVDTASELIGRVVVQPGASVTGSRVVGPAIIGSHSQVTDSYIGPFTSLGEGCRVADSEIEYYTMCGDRP
jgi:glucose-1-phosphate thymidylyltransferase